MNKTSGFNQSKLLRGRRGPQIELYAKFQFKWMTDLIFLRSLNSMGLVYLYLSQALKIVRIQLL